MEPSERDTLLQEATALHQQGNLRGAEGIYQRVLVHFPQDPSALHGLGLLAHQVGKHALAVQLIQACLATAPQDAAAWNNCGEAFRNLSNHDEALKCYRQAVLHGPEIPIFWNSLGNGNANVDQWDEAERAYRRAIDLQPGYAKAWYNLGGLHRRQGRFVEGEAAIRKALEINPGMAEAWNGLGALLRAQKRAGEAEACYREALRIRPAFADALANLGGCLRDVGRLTEAEAAYRQALAIKPSFGEACSGLGSVLRECGRADEAGQWYEKALTIEPKNPRFLSNLLFVRHAIAPQPSHDAFALARRWGKSMSRDPIPRPATPSTRTALLRIGYLSPDFRNHPVATFIQPVLASHNPAHVEVHCFSSVALPDERTAALRALCPRWHEIHGLSDFAAAQLIAKQQIDVLVDLGGHTRGSRLGVLGYRPSPVQATYLGYFATTGLPEVDFWISDDVLHPPGSPELATERICRLPRCWICYGQPQTLPNISATGGGVTFGSFNHLSKLVPATLDLWASVLRAVPESRLLLKTRHLGDSTTAAHVAESFQQRGIPSDRLTLIGFTPLAKDHLAQYNEIDVALDTFPFTGGTTTAEALLMGVPVLTRCGETMPSRMSATMLTALGMETWIGRSNEEFVQKAVSFAQTYGPLPASTRLTRRADIRSRFLSSALCDGPGLAAVLEDAYHSMIEQVDSR